MDWRQFRKSLRRIWRKNNLKFSGVQPGVPIEEISRASDKRNRAKRLTHFDLWNEIYDQYASWFLSLSLVLFLELKRAFRSKGSRKGPRYEFFRATVLLALRIFSDLLSIRLLCRAGFDVGAKALTRSTAEHIDMLALLILQPALAKKFNRSDGRDSSNAFWHQHVSRGKIREKLIPIWASKFSDQFDAKGWDDWLYGYHRILGMSVHPSHLGGVFSALVLGSGSRDNWLGFFGDRGDISTDTFYHVVLHIWKLALLFPDFPFRNEVNGKLAVRYDAKDELHQHVKTGGAVLVSILTTMWDRRISKHFFADPDVSNIWPDKKKRKKRLPGSIRRTRK